MRPLTPRRVQVRDRGDQLQRLAFDGTWAIGSECDPRTSHTVNLSSDGRALQLPGHLGQECEHSLAAVMLSRTLVGLERHRVFHEAPVPAPLGTTNGWHTIDDRDYAERRHGLKHDLGKLAPVMREN